MILGTEFGVLHRYRRGLGSTPGKPEFFQAFFSQLDKLRLYLLSRFQYTKFISSPFQNLECLNKKVSRISVVKLFLNSPVSKFTKQLNKFEEVFPLQRYY